MKWLARQHGEVPKQLERTHRIQVCEEIKALSNYGEKTKPTPKVSSVSSSAANPGKILHGSAQREGIAKWRIYTKMQTVPTKAAWQECENVLISHILLNNFAHVRRASGVPCQQRRVYYDGWCRERVQDTLACQMYTSSGSWFWERQQETSPEGVVTSWSALNPRQQVLINSVLLTS